MPKYFSFDKLISDNYNKSDKKKVKYINGLSHAAFIIHN